MKMLVILAPYIRKQMSDGTRVDVPGSKSAVEGVLDVHDIEATNVPLAVDNDASATHVAPAGDHADVASVKLDKVGDLALLEIKTDGIVGPDERIRVANGAAIVGDDIRNAAGPDSNTLDF